MFFVSSQTLKSEKSTTFMCLSDFVAPRSSDKHDYIGMFAVSVGFGVEELCAK